jgi:hypothetical protein
MTDTLDGFPFWALEFAKDAIPGDAAAIDRMVREVKDTGLTDLFIFSHGWNADRNAAISLYGRFFEELGKIIRDDGVPKRQPAAKIGLAGVIWPSILWPDDAPSAGPEPVLPAPRGGGGVSMRAAASGVPAKTVAPKEIQTALAPSYDAGQRAILDELTTMLQAREGSQAALDAFKAKLGELLGSEGVAGADPRQPDDAEGAMATLDTASWNELLDQLGSQAEERGSATSSGGAAGLGDRFRKLWNGAKDALRIGTYWQMKNRAAVVGRQGLGPVLDRLAKEVPALRVHLLGHSFGARLVSFSLSGLSDSLTGSSSPVKSLFLLQGAFSHYAFADKLPADASRSGALKAMSKRVDGPLLTTHSLRDYAVGVTYPAASMVNGDDAAAFDAVSDRWGAMGHDGAQGVSAQTAKLSPPGMTYSLAKGAWLNLDGNDVIIHGSLPAGAHSDIVHPHTAWASLAAAGIV